MEARTATGTAGVPEAVDGGCSAAVSPSAGGRTGASRKPFRLPPQLPQRLVQAPPERVRGLLLACEKGGEVDEGLALRPHGDEGRRVDRRAVLPEGGVLGGEGG